MPTPVLFRFHKAMLFSLAVFTLLITAIQSQPYDNVSVRDFLAPSTNCALACFMGISLGQSSVDEAVNILNASVWVASVSRRTLRDNTDYVEWRWSGQQPSFIPTESGGYLQGDKNATAARINIRTTLSPADLWWLYGEPLVEVGCLEYCPALHFNFAYPDQGIVLSATTSNCVLPLRALTESQTTLKFYAVENLALGTNNFQNFVIHSLKTFGKGRHCH